MAATILILLAMCCVPAFGDLEGLSAELLPREIEEMKATQERLATREDIEKTFPEEDRESNCIPLGGVCGMWTGPSCCGGIRTRCVYHATYEWGVQYTGQRLPTKEYRNLCMESIGKHVDDALQKVKNFFGK